MRANLVFALALSGLASLATVLGSLLGMAVRRPGPKLMAFALGFSAGVMMFVSFAELLWTGIHDVGFLPAAGAFFGGMLVMFAIDATVPHRFVLAHGAEPGCTPADSGSGQLDPQRLLKIGTLVALGIGIHNLPEGMATFSGAIKSRGLGVAIAAAIALHNIPEGVAVAVPVFCATGSRRKALFWSLLAGGAELAGAFIAAVILLPFLTPQFLAVTLSAVAGLMVFISFDELIPGSYAYGFEHLSVSGIIAGMFLMAASIWLLR